MLNRDVFQDYEIMAVSCFAGALLYMAVGQVSAACGLVLGFVAGLSAFHSEWVAADSLNEIQAFDSKSSNQKNRMGRAA